jgi:hypothetical protein
LGEKKERKPAAAAAVDGMERNWKALDCGIRALRAGLGWAEFVLLGQALVNRTEENYCSERAKSKPFPNLAGDG